MEPSPIPTDMLARLDQLGVPESDGGLGEGSSILDACCATDPHWSFPATENIVSYFIDQTILILNWGTTMRKNISKRRWKARLMNGKWIPIMVIQAYHFSVPDGYLAVEHPDADFFRIFSVSRDKRKPR
jgi:hypothetical protein